MNVFSRTLFAVLILLLAMVPVFSQNSDTSSQKSEKKPTRDPANGETRADGLRKITTRAIRDRDFDIKIDAEAIELNIEFAIESAMKSVEGALEALQINIDPIEIKLGDLNLDMDPIEINLPRLNIDIEPIEIELGDLDIDMDINEDHVYWNEDGDNYDENNDDDDNGKLWQIDELTSPKNKNKEKDKKKDKSDQKEKDKSKGLKKIN